MNNLILAGMLSLVTTVNAGFPCVDLIERNPELEPFYTMSQINSWQLPWTSFSYWFYDLDYDEATGTLRTVSQSPNLLCLFSASDPTVLTGSMGLSFPETIHAVATAPSGTGQPYIWVTESSYEGRYFRYYNGSWTWYEGNPPGEYGMGIDIDESGYIWESGYGGAVFRFFPGSSTYQLYSLQIPDVYPEGLTLFPYHGGTGVAIGYETNKIVEFYLYTPPYTWVLLGSASVPGTFERCMGLEYLSDRGTFYMLVKESQEYRILELSCDVMDLQSDTWGSIKSSFQ